MSDWKDRIDKCHADREAARQKRRGKYLSEEAIREREEEEREEERKQAELEEYCKKYPCSVCGKLPEGPSTLCKSQRHDGGERIEWIDTWYVGWNEPPKSRAKCSRCNNYVCAECLYRGTCKHCAEKL